MKHHLKVCFLVILTLFMICSVLPAAAVTLPSGLTVISDEAFMGSNALTGVLTLPAGVTSVGKDAFSGTALYALDVPAGVMQLGAQSLPKAAYVHVHGKATQVEALSGVKYVIAPEGSAVQSAAAACGIDFVSESTLVEADGFYFRATTEGLVLLSAKNADSISGEVTIPHAVGQQKVIGVSDYAFIGCQGVQSIQLPEKLQGSLSAGALADCPNASVTYYGDPVTIKSVEADVTAGALGNSITWRVDAAAQFGIKRYLYKLEHNGVEIASKESTSSTFTYDALEPGEYQLLVIVSDRSGNSASSRSAALYIAREAMLMTVPETLAAGSDLEITVDEVAGAEYYMVLVTDETTGSRMGGIRTLTKPGKITISGYSLVPGQYRVTGYVIGNDFRYTVPTVKYITMTGTMAEGPAMPEQQPILVNNGRQISLSATDPFAIRCQAVFSDGTTSTWSIYTGKPGSPVYIYFGSDQGDWSKGGTVRLQGALKVNGTWTAWGPMLEVPVQSAPKLATPEFTAPASVEAGVDVQVQTVAVENAFDYSLHLYAGYYPEQGHREGESLWYEGNLRENRTAVIPGYQLDAGVYTIQTYVWADGYESSYYEQRLEVTGTRAAAPVVTADKTEVATDRSVRIDIECPGAEGAVIIPTASKTGGDEHRWGSRTVSLDENGRGYYNYSVMSDSQFEGYTYTCKVAVIKDGKWSQFATVSFLQTAREPLAKAVITAPATIEAGCDLTYSFASVEHADNYRVSVYRAYSEYSGPSESGANLADQERTLPGCDLTAGTYYIKVVAISDEYGESTSEVAFTVTGARPNAPVVTLDKTTAVMRENFTFTIDTTGGEVLRYRTGSSSSSTAINVIEDTTTWTTYQWSTGEYNYAFSLYKDGKWSAWSAPILIKITDTALAAPALTVPSSLTAGQDLTVTVGAVSNAKEITVELYNRAGNRMASITLNDGNGGSVTFEGYYFTSGQYTVEATAQNDNGSNTAQSNVNVRTTNRPAAPETAADTELGRVSVKYGFTINTTGAEMAAVRYYRVDNTNSVTYKALTATGDSTYWTDYNYTAGQVWNYAFAVKKDGVWSSWSKTMQVTITDREQLAQTVLTMPESVAAGQDVQVSFSAVPNADSYSLYLYKPDGNYISYSARPNEERLLYGYDLMPGTYQIKVTASGAEYDSSETVKSFTVTGSRPAAPAVSVDKRTVLTNEVFTFMIENGASDMIYYRCDNSSGKLNAPTDVTAWETSRYNAGTYSYSFCVLKDGCWSAWSTGITVTVTQRPKLPEPVITLPASIVSGQDLTVSVAAVEGATSYDVYLYDLRGTQISSRYMSSAGNAVFTGYLLPDGYVRVQVTANGKNGSSSTVSQTLKIEAATLPAAPAVTPPASSSVASGEYITFAVDATGADKCVVRYYRIGSPNDLYYSTFDAGKEYRTYSTNSGATYAFSFAVRVNGVWSSWSDFTEINID